MEYTVILEKGESSYGAFVPDLRGCIAAGESKEEALNLIKEAIEFHIEGLKCCSFRYATATPLFAAYELGRYVLSKK